MISYCKNVISNPSQDFWVDVVPRNESVPVPAHTQGPILLLSALWHPPTSKHHTFLLTVDYAALQIVHCWSINYPLSSDLIIWPLSLIRQVGVCHADDLLYLWEPVFISAPFNEEVNLKLAPSFVHPSPNMSLSEYWQTIFLFWHFFRIHFWGRSWSRPGPTLPSEMMLMATVLTNCTNNRFGNPSALNLYGPSWNWTPLEEGLPHRYWN